MFEEIVINENENSSGWNSSNKIRLKSKHFVKGD